MRRTTLALAGALLALGGRTADIRVAGKSGIEKAEKKVAKQAAKTP